MSPRTSRRKTFPGEDEKAPVSPSDRSEEEKAPTAPDSPPRLPGDDTPSPEGESLKKRRGGPKTGVKMLSHPDGNYTVMRQSDVGLMPIPGMGLHMPRNYALSKLNQLCRDNTNLDGIEWVLFKLVEIGKVGHRTQTKFTLGFRQKIKVVMDPVRAAASSDESMESEDEG